MGSIFSRSIRREYIILLPTFEEFCERLDRLVEIRLISRYNRTVMISSMESYSYIARVHYRRNDRELAAVIRWYTKRLCNRRKVMLLQNYNSTL